MEQAKKGSLKRIVVMLFLLAVLITGAYGYFKLNGILKTNEEAKALINNQAAYENTLEAVETEYLRCKSFIVQEEGDFASFAYCQKFLEWADAYELSPDSSS